MSGQDWIVGHLLGVRELKNWLWYEKNHTHLYQKEDILLPEPQPSRALCAQTDIKQGNNYRNWLIRVIESVFGEGPSDVVTIEVNLKEEKKPATCRARIRRFQVTKQQEQWLWGRNEISLRNTTIKASVPGILRVRRIVWDCVGEVALSVMEKVKEGWNRLRETGWQVTSVDQACSY